MSFNTFKANMENYMTNQGGIGAFTDFAKKITQEYNMCILRGFQDTNMIPLSAGNTAGMEALVVIACATALSKSDGLHTFADDIGKGVVAFWTGATLTVGIPPIIPATGAIQNITTTAAVCMNPGAWSPIGPLSNTNETSTFLSLLAAGMQTHLTTTVFMYSTISIYPGAPPPVAPGVLIHPAYLVPG
jgi:hypothetical protein